MKLLDKDLRPLRGQERLGLLLGRVQARRLVVQFGGEFRPRVRLSTEQIIAGVIHADQEMRSEAVYYFVGEYSQVPAIMPLVIQDIETYGFANAFRAYYFLDSLVRPTRRYAGSWPRFAV